MPSSDHAAASAATSQSPAQDTQTLIGLLDNLMPLLLRIQQSRSVEHTFQGGPVGLMAPHPLLDQQAAVSLVEDITASSLNTLSSYLEAHAGRYPVLESCIPIVTQAAHCFALRDFGQAFGLIWETFRAITLLRAANPQLPALRTAGSLSTAINRIH